MASANLMVIRAGPTARIHIPQVKGRMVIDDWWRMLPGEAITKNLLKIVLSDGLHLVSVSHDEQERRVEGSFR